MENFIFCAMDVIAKSHFSIYSINILRAWLKFMMKLFLQKELTAIFAKKKVGKFRHGR